MIMMMMNSPFVIRETGSEIGSISIDDDARQAKVDLGRQK
jgi:hypothetical protein